MRVYVVEMYNWMEYCGIKFVTADQDKAVQFCNQKNKTSRSIEYRVVGKNLKGFKNGK